MPVKPTSYRDRTNEFQSVAQKLKRPSSLPSASTAPNSTTDGAGAGAGANSISAAPEPTRSAAPIQSEFNKRASRIALGIHQTSQKLSKLAKLAKKTSVFDDPTSEIQELTAVIKQDINALNSGVVDLQLLSNSQNEGNLSSDSSAHSTTVVDNLKNSLMSTTKEFKEILTLRTENLKVHENRRQLFSSSASKESSNPFIRQRPLATRTAASAAISPPPWAAEPGASSQLFPRNQADGESQPLLHQQQSQQQLAPSQDNFMHSRATALQNVESTIHELGNIFTQLATMVSQQGELAIRIDENMEDTLANVEGAQSQLMSQQCAPIFSELEDSGEDFDSVYTEKELKGQAHEAILVTSVRLLASQNFEAAGSKLFDVLDLHILSFANSNHCSFHLHCFS